MEMRQAARGGGDFAPGIEDDPADKGLRRFVVAGVAGEAAGEEGKVVEKVVQLVEERAAGVHEVALQIAIMLEDKSRFGLPVGVKFREIIGEQFAVLENRINGFAKISCLATKTADVRAVGRPERPDDGIGGHSVGEA